MSDPNNPQLEAVLRALRAQYLSDSDARVAELREDLARIEHGEHAALDELRRHFHKLAGSGGSYGLQHVTDISRAAEHVALDLYQAGVPPGGEALAELRQQVGRVADAFAAAKSDDASSASDQTRR